MTPISAWIFWTGSNDFAGRIIRRVTGLGPWTHVGIGYNLASDKQVYFEAHWSHGAFAGPVDAAKLTGFELQRPGNRLTIRHLDLSHDDLMTAWERTWSMIDTRHGYARWQLVQIWALERLGLRVRHSPHKVICSEAVSRILNHIVDLRGERRHDEVTPNSAYEQFLIWEAVL
jgi:hypothetical protein